jgi:hypothetical protein
MSKTIGQIPTPYKKIFMALVRADSPSIDMVFAAIKGGGGDIG